MEELKKAPKKEKKPPVVEKKEEPKKEEPKKEEPKNEEIKKDPQKVEMAKKLFENITNFGKFKKDENLKVETAKQVSTALNAIKNIGTAAGYQDTSKSREKFLGAVALYLGLDEKKLGSLQKNVYNGDNKLTGKYVDNLAAEFLMHLRNLIAYGLDYGTGDAMPDIDKSKLEQTKSGLLKKLKIEQKTEKYPKGKDLYDAIVKITGEDIIKTNFRPDKNKATEMFKKIEKLVKTKTNEPSLLDAENAFYSTLMIPLVNALYNNNKCSSVEELVKLMRNNFSENGNLLYGIDQIIKQTFNVEDRTDGWKKLPLNNAQ